MTTDRESSHSMFTPARVSALLLVILGGSVLSAWHNPGFFKSAYAIFVLMAYGTAICFLLSGLALFSLSWKINPVARSCSILCLFIPFFSLVELCCQPGWDINQSLMIFIETLPHSPVRMAPTTSISFILASTAIVSLSYLQPENSGKYILVAFLTILVFAIASLALAGHGVGLIPAFEWFGVKMAPQTAVGFLILSAGIISYSYKPALIAFSRLNFLNHMVIAFGFMTTLFLIFGVIVLNQIDTVSSITRELYKNPLQVNNSAFRIKEAVGNFNRLLKNIAIQPELYPDPDILSQVAKVEEKVRGEIAFIRQKHSATKLNLQDLELGLTEWRLFIEKSARSLQAGDLEAYRLTTLNEQQQKVIELEAIAENIILQAQQQIMDLSASVNRIENDAEKLILISIFGLLSLGLLVAYVITHSLTNQLDQLRHAMLDIANKRMDRAIPFVDHTQEIGDMARALEVFAKNISAGMRMETRMRQIIEAAPNGIIMINESGLMEVVNAQAEKIFGYERDQLLGFPIEQLVPKRAAQDHPQNRANFFANPSPRAMGAGRELYALRKDGFEVPVEIGLAPIQTEEGVKVLASIVDISERKKSAKLLMAHQLDLEKANRELERTNKELEAFAYVASHDLKSPLRGISQLSNWIEEDLAEQQFDSVTGHTKMLRSRILRMEKLLDDLLLFYRAGKTDNNLGAIDVRSIALELFEIQNNKPGLRLQLGENLPVFNGLRTPFEQVLRNLFSNAIKHHDLAEGVLSLTCEDAGTGFYLFSLADDGPGIPEKYHQRIFGMFQTLKPRDELEGSGMGLALIKKIIENYGGRISVESVGRGSCFSFSWPKVITRANIHD